jgi:hypothetical protein
MICSRDPGARLVLARSGPPGYRSRGMRRRPGAAEVVFPPARSLESRRSRSSCRPSRAGRSRARRRLRSPLRRSRADRLPDLRDDGLAMAGGGRDPAVVVALVGVSARPRLRHQGRPHFGSLRAPLGWPAAALRRIGHQRRREDPAPSAAAPPPARASRPTTAGRGRARVPPRPLAGLSGRDGRPQPGPRFCSASSSRR